MPDTNLTLAEFNEHIALIEDNLRNLVEEAAAYSGANDEDRAAGRIAEQERELEVLKQQRDALR